MISSHESPKTSTGDPTPCLLSYIIPTPPSVSSLTRMFSPVSASLYSYAPVLYLLSYHPSPIYTLCYYSSSRGGLSVGRLFRGLRFSLYFWCACFVMILIRAATMLVFPPPNLRALVLPQHSLCYNPLGSSPPGPQLKLDVTLFE